MSKEDIINYVMTTPGNPNRAVLSGMLDSITGASEETTILTEESVTTQVYEDSPYATGNLAYSELIDADTIQVTFEGEKYICQKRSVLSPGGEGYEYGASIDAKSDLPDFSQFPFRIFYLVFEGNVMSEFFTETAGTYQIKIEIPQEDSGSTSEWSTAQVSFANNGESDYNVYISHMLENSSFDFVSERITIPGSTSEVTTLLVPLYHNHYFLKFNSFEADLNGNEILGQITRTDKGFLIKGNGTISLTGTGGR